MINDFSNQIIKGENNYELAKSDFSIGEKNLAVVLEGDEDSASFIVDYGKHYHKEFYSKDYTELVVMFDSAPDEKNIDQALIALDYFISIYRVITDDVLTLPIDKMTYVPRIYKEYFYNYSNEELDEDPTKRLTTSRSVSLGVKQVLFPFWNTQGKKFITDVPANTKRVETFLSNNNKLESLPEFVLKAREELYIHNNFKHSFLESWTIMEMAIVAYLRKKKIEMGIAKNKIDDLSGEVGISYLLNIELPLVYENPEDTSFKDMISQIDKVRKIRNKLVHENRGITEEEAKNALIVAIALLNFVGYRKY